MIAIVDSGSTKTLWCFISRSMDIQKIHTSGMNPNFITDKDIIDISQILLSKLATINSEPLESIYFYGAGCSSNVGKEKIKLALTRIFPVSIIDINTDILGACIGSCGTDSGIVGILGTGSNSCVYSDGIIVRNIAALGYTLCDEGSGNHIGKLLLKAYLRNTMPTELRNAFAEQYPYDTSYFLHHLYNQPFPNRFLASFAPFAYNHRQEAFVKELLHVVFSSFFEEQVIQYPEYHSYPLHLVGSIAHYFSSDISTVAQHYGIDIASTHQSPIDGLIKYYCR